MIIKVKVIRKPDTKALSILHMASFYKGWSAAYITESLKIEGTLAVVAHGYRGFALLRCSGDEARILTLAVRTDILRRGIGKALLDAALWEAAYRKARTVTLMVNEHNAAGLSLYAGRGFLEVERVRHHYSNPDGTRSHALVMRRSLSS